MTAPISNDLRERVVSAVLSGESVRAVAARFEVGASSVVKWSQRYRATGSSELLDIVVLIGACLCLIGYAACPVKMGCAPPYRDFIVERLAQNPHLTLHGLKGSVGISVFGGHSG